MTKCLETSLNIHGKKVPGIISEIKSQFDVNDIALYINSGRLKGLPSTIVDVTTLKPKIIRKGRISLDKLMEVI